MSDGETSNGPLSRRAMLRTSAATAAGIGLTGLGTARATSASPSEEDTTPARKGRSMMGVPFETHETVRMGVIGLGNRGSAMLAQILAVPGVRVTALCDVDVPAVRRAAARITDHGDPAPAQYTRGENDFENLCARDDVDFVYVVTPWEWHVPMALAAMRGGKHAGVECPIAPSIKDLWELVDTSERTRRHCIQLENCCYGRNEMRVLRMAHEEKFGTLLHGAGGYIHDLRELLFSDSYYSDEWRRAWHTERDGDLYPTHGLGPVSSYMDINRGDRLVRLTSMGSPAASLSEYRARNVGEDDAARHENYVKGDVTMSLIQTERGRVIHLVHDVSSPHPYSRLNHLVGSRGVFEDYPARIYLEPDMGGHEWGDFADYSSYDHWLWKEVDPGPGGGHGGMDYIMLYRLAQTMKLGLPPDIDVYDSAAWSAPFALSAASITGGGAPVEFPDFTRGEWKTPHPGVDSARPDS
ncbi:Gfo/Idh/MocA family protein [Actinopolyspora halophila]|uniref:Gfo/Idh/MocA family protein n=1 Tax=Actinopolyspora halophila TaxID=1850 RepID=UPI00036B43FF|nr:Gfo/Idh/MocA family oxidoreductase [Actinopolyspora halophila]